MKDNKFVETIYTRIRVTFNNSMNHSHSHFILICLIGLYL